MLFEKDFWGKSVGKVIVSSLLSKHFFDIDRVFGILFDMASMLHVEEQGEVQRLEYEEKQRIYSEARRHKR